MQLIPYIGEEPMRSDAFKILVSEEDSHRVTRMLMRCAAVTVVANKETFDAATTTAGQLKALLVEIQDAKRSAKRPFEAVETAIETKAQQISESLANEAERIRGLMNAYVAQLEAQAKAERRRREEQQRLEREKLQADLDRAKAAQRAAEEAARRAQDEAARLRHQQEAKRMADAALDAELDQMFAAELSNLGAKPKVALVPGGRVSHPWKFKLIDVKAAVDAGYLRCMRWEPDILACNDVVKAQLERKGPDAIPHIPGFQIWQETSVSVRASA